VFGTIDLTAPLAALVPEPHLGLQRIHCVITGPFGLDPRCLLCVPSSSRQPPPAASSAQRRRRTWCLTARPRLFLVARHSTPFRSNFKPFRESRSMKHTHLSPRTPSRTRLDHVAHLLYTARDMQPFASDYRLLGAPFRLARYAPSRLRAEFVVAFFTLYGLIRNEAAYNLDTFPIVRRDEECRFGTFLTNDLILTTYESFATGSVSRFNHGSGLHATSFRTIRRASPVDGEGTTASPLGPARRCAPPAGHLSSFPAGGNQPGHHGGQT